ncbi:MAG: MFS transporter, partial [Candidatus Lokiarchaeota archaeon]|nr:MFS transporter [Candidatus Lokiarchaeota archaeon]MBD3342664.1 MFS transporter [Candidatus Lokiarchaeota archaeon]
AIWNAVNDPLVGFICDRPFFFTKKWGRRFPWIISSIIPAILTYILLFTPPNIDPKQGEWSLFIWLVLTTCLFDTAFSFVFVNSSALFADKFRNDDERRKVSGINMGLGYIGIAVGSLIPPLFVSYGVKESFINQAWALVIVALIAAIFMIPGMREDKGTIERYLRAQMDSKGKQKRNSFFGTFFSAFKQKNFTAFVILFLGYAVLRICLLASMQYGIRYILKEPAATSSLIMGGFLLGSLISIPLWIWWARKKQDNRKVMIVTAILSSIFALPMIFINNLFGWIIILFLWGIGIAGMFIVRAVVLADIIDESVANTQDRNEGMYYGFFLFINRLSIVIQAVIFAVVHDITGFVEGAETQSELAIWGIRLSMAVIPVFFLVIATIIFWRFYDLKPDKLEDIKARIIDLDL